MVQKTKSATYIGDIEKYFTRSELALFAVVLIGTVLRFYHLGYRSLYFDEANQFFVSLNPLYLINDPGNLPLSHYIQHFVMFFGHSETMLRFAPAVFGSATIIAAYYLGRMLFDKQTGLIGSLFVSISPLLIYYSQEARPYSQYAFFATASLLFLILVTKKATITRYIGYFITTILCLYTHIFAVCLLLGQNIFLLLLWKKEKIKLKYWIATQILILFAYIPAILFMLETVQQRAPVPYSILKTIAGIFYVFSFGRLLLPIDLNIIVVVVGMLIFAGCMLLSIKGLWDNKNRTFLFFFSFAITFVFILIANYRFHAFNEEDVRYLIFLSPLFYMMIANGVCRIERQKKKNLVFFLTLIILATSLYPYYANWDTLGKGNFRSAAEFIKRQGLNSDDLILSSDKQIGAVMRYYLNHHMNFRIIRTDRPLLSGQESPQKIIIFGFTDRTAMDLIRNTGIENDPWSGAGYTDELLQKGYLPSANSSWPGKNRIDAFVYEKNKFLK